MLVRAYSFRVPFAYSCILCFHVGHVGWNEKTSNDDFARHNSFHELECLSMCDPIDVRPYQCEIFEKVLVNVSCFGL